MNMESYFIRHTSKIAVSVDDINRIFDQNKIAIHFPGHGEEDSESTDPKDYDKKSDKRAISCLKKLSQKGGYIWAEYYTKPHIVKIGKVKPQNVEIFISRWKECDNTRRREGDIAKLKTLRVENVKHLRFNETGVMAMRQVTPRKLTVAQWKTIKNRLKNLVEEKPLAGNWEELLTEQQETVCAEYLRNDTLEECPRLEFLLLPIGRTMLDVDIYGCAKDGSKIFAQVTNYDKKKQICQEKIKKLEQYGGDHNHLVFFCKCDERTIENNILIVPITEVFEWLRRNITYFKILFDEK